MLEDGLPPAERRAATYESTESMGNFSRSSAREKIKYKERDRIRVV